MSELILVLFKDEDGVNDRIVVNSSSIRAAWLDEDGYTLLDCKAFDSPRVVSFMTAIEPHQVVSSLEEGELDNLVEVEQDDD